MASDVAPEHSAVLDQAGRRAGFREAPLVGRDDVLGALDRALEAANRREASVVLVRGEPGIGKSRLVREFAHRSCGPLELWGSCLNMSDPPAYGPFMSIIRAALEALGRDKADAILPQRGRDYLARLLRAFEQPASAVADPRVALFESVVLALDELSRERPVLVVIEDLHWIDQSSWDLLTYLATELDDQAVLIVATCRHLPHSHRLRHPLYELSRLRHVMTVDLEPLGSEAVATVAASLLGRRPDAAALSALVAQSGGNPFFVEVLTTGPGGSAQVREHLVVTLDQLSATTQRVLHLAAVAGPYVGHDLLRVVTGLDGPLSEGLRQAVDAGMLVAEGNGYRFRHVLLGEAVYEELLLPGERARMHRSFGEAIDDDPALARPEHCYAAGEAGRHWEAGGDPTRAIAAFWRSVGEARALNFHPERRTMLDKVLELWPRVTDAAELLGTSPAELRYEAVEAADLSGDIDLGMARAEGAIAAALAERRPYTAARVLERRARMRRRLGILGATEDLREALRITEGEPLTGQRARLEAYLAQRLWVTGEDPDAVRDQASRARELAHRTGDDFAAIHADLTLAWLPALDGAVEESRQAHREARARAATIGDDGSIVRSFIDESDLMLSAGEHGPAADAARNGMRYAADVGMGRTPAAQAAGHLAEPLVAMGSWDEAWEVLAAALQAEPPRGYRASLLCLRARLSMWRGHIDAAHTDVEAIRQQIGPLFETPSDQFVFALLDAELRLAESDAHGACQVVRDAFRAYPPGRAPSRAWPLITVAALATRTAGNAWVRPLAEELPCRTTSDQAWRAGFVAATATPSTLEAARRGEVEAWRRTREPARLAIVLRAAAADFAQSEEARTHLQEADALATRLGAEGIRSAIVVTAAARGVDVEEAAAPAPEVPGNAVARSWGLTPRESQVLREIAQGKTNREIAATLFITPKTASVHVSRILMKMDAATRSEATAKAYRHRAVSLDDHPDRPE